ISGYGEFSEQVKAGALRLLAISADKRQEGIDAPTMKEAGIDVELFNWRGVFAPPGVSDADKAAMITLVETMAKSEAWATECKNRNWTQILLTGDDYAKFLTEDTARIAAILKDLGLA
ncbi:MAG: tripartite tricarboxylate transporter substrate binding protein, partial [Mesorhizobium sp.]